MSFGLLISSDLPKLLSKLSLILSTLLFPGLFTGCFVTLFSVYAILAHLCGFFSATSEASCMETIYPVFRSPFSHILLMLSSTFFVCLFVCLFFFFFPVFLKFLFMFCLLVLARVGIGLGP